MQRKWILWLCLAALVLSFPLGGVAGYMAAQRVEPTQKVIVKERDPEKATDAFEQQKPVDREMTVVEVAETCTKSVVNITVKEKKKGYTGGSTYTETVTGYGTGVIYRQDGYIVTCYHVIEGADMILVSLENETEYAAQLVGYDDRFDLAVLKVEDADLPATALGECDQLRAGEGVVIIGNPLGSFGSSVSAGVLSSTARELTIEGIPLRLMQTDAAVNPGNSGGGMFNMHGQLIGIVNAKMSASGIEGLGFAIPLNTIQEKVDTIIVSGSTGQKAVLGVSTKTAICYLDEEKVDCVEITSVREDGAAEKAGLVVGDYLLSANGKTLKTNDDLTLVIKYCEPGDQVEFTVVRDGKKISVTVTLSGS